jgi:hypothetical protein
MFKQTVSENETKISNVDLANAKEVLKLGREVENADLWKIYGRESEAGKMLFKLFGKGPSSIKINYPKPKTEKTKPLPFEETRKADKECPQKAVVEYPPVKGPYRYIPKKHAVDMIPKRKNEVEIRKEIDDFYSKPVIPVNKGVNRKKMVDDLQNKFKKQRGALPKGAEMPLYQPEEGEVLEEIDEEELQKRALQKMPKKLLAYTYERPKDDQENKKGITKDEEDNELEKLYEEIEREIEERQSYLEEIAPLDEPKIKERVKKEIIERVAELQKIIKMLRRQE